MYTLTREQYLDTTLSEAWYFLKNPANLNQITPDNLRFQIISEIPEDFMVTYDKRSVRGSYVSDDFQYVEDFDSYGDNSMDGVDDILDDYFEDNNPDPYKKPS